MSLRVAVISSSISKARYGLADIFAGEGKDILSRSPRSYITEDNTEYVIVERETDALGCKFDQLLLIDDNVETVTLSKAQLIRQVLLNLRCHSFVPRDFQIIVYNLV